MKILTNIDQNWKILTTIDKVLNNCILQIFSYQDYDKPYCTIESI